MWVGCARDRVCAWWLQPAVCCALPLLPGCPFAGGAVRPSDEMPDPCALCCARCVQSMSTHQADIMQLIRDVLVQQIGDPGWVGGAGAGAGARAGRVWGQPGLELSSSLELRGSCGKLACPWHPAHLMVLRSLISPCRAHAHMHTCMQFRGAWRAGLAAPGDAAGPAAVQPGAAGAQRREGAARPHQAPAGVCWLVGAGWWMLVLLVGVAEQVVGGPNTWDLPSSGL